MFSALPAAIRARLDGFVSTGRNLRTRSEAGVFLFERGDSGLILKQSRSRLDAPLKDEAAAMRWLHGRLPVPEVVVFHEADGAEYLLVTRLRGLSACDERLLADSRARSDLFAEGLRRVQAVPPGDCPFDRSPDALVERGRSRIAENRIDLQQLRDAGFRGRPGDVLDELERTKPSVEGPVFTHGDYCMPNVLIHDGRISGFIDFGHAGAGDPCRDYASADYTIRRNLGEEWVAPFFEGLGVSLDAPKLAWYRAIQLFG